MTQDEIIRMAREAGFSISAERYLAAHQCTTADIERFAALVAAHVKSDQIQTAYQQGCEDMKRRMEKRMQQLEGQLQLCQTAVAHEREACAKVCENLPTPKDATTLTHIPTLETCAAAIRARDNHASS